jgi:hypothetical protein
MEDKIKDRVIKLFKPLQKTIDNQSNCEHNWKDKDGSAYYRCKKCGYLTEDRELDKLITINKMIKKGLSPKIIKSFKKYI